MPSDSVPGMARLGARMMSFAQKSWAEMASDHLRNMKGYGDYADNAAVLRDTGTADAANAFVDVNTWGTPRQILDKLVQRRKLIGCRCSVRAIFPNVSLHPHEG